MRHTSQDRAIDPIVLDLCEAVGTPRSLGIYLRYKYSQESFVDMKLDPRDYLSPSSFAGDYMIFNLLKKFKGLRTGVDTKDVAIKKFFDSEERCRDTNDRITRGLLSSSACSVFHEARRKISRVLGPFSLSRVRRCEWTTGATTDIPRRNAFVDTKLTQLPIDVTPLALPFLRMDIEHDPSWFEAVTGIYPDGPFSVVKEWFSLVKGNRVTTVAKDSSTDRVIAIEPRGNIFLQKGVGNYIRKRLLHFGIDLSNQGKNQLLAGMAQEYGLATVDLKSASDTIAKQLVFELLPLDWAFYLDRVRSPFYLVPGGTSAFEHRKSEKFSSMGNGFTFELETLIFWALSESVMELSRIEQHRFFIAVYGDDIIIPKEAYPLLKDVLSESGFEVNTSKTFSDGLFFESCGKHYFDGVDVTPIYQKENLDDVEAMRLANRLCRWALRVPSRGRVIRRPWFTIREHFGTLWWAGCRMPLLCEGDDAWLIPFRFQHSLLRIDRDTQRYVFRAIVVRFSKKRLAANEKANYANFLRTGLSFPKIDEVDLAMSDQLPYIPMRDVELEDHAWYEIESARFTLARRSIALDPELAFRILF